MPFVKLDCGILNSTIWVDRLARELFITSLLMAEPRELIEAMPQITVGQLEYTGWSVPPGWYGFVEAAGPGIIARAGLDDRGPLFAAAMEALTRLGDPEPDSRSHAFVGRRLVRVDGGFVVLNYIQYREKDSTAAERSRRWRERQKAKALRVTDTPIRVIRHQAEVEVEAEAYTEAVRTSLDRLRDRFEVFWTAYPRKVGKGAALKEWAKLAPSDDLAAAMVSAVQQQAQSPQWRKDAGQFIPHPRTWLSQGRWQDEVEAQAQRVMSDAAATVMQTLGVKL